MIASTADNLQAAIAVKDKHKAKTMFTFVVDAEEAHAQIYTKALDSSPPHFADRSVAAA